MQELNGILVEKYSLTPYLFIIRVKPEFEIPDFLPGQYVALGLPQSTGRLIKRAYSICSSPEQKDWVEFYISLVEGGALTPLLHSLQIGDKLFIAKKFTGRFTLLEIPPGKRLVFVSTGTGIAPFVSMLRTATTIDRYPEITLFHGVRYKEDLAYDQEMSELTSKFSQFRYVPILSRPGSEWHGKSGYVQDHIFECLPNLSPESDHVFLCGNPAMVDLTEQKFQLMGFVPDVKKDKGNLHFERFW